MPSGRSLRSILNTNEELAEPPSIFKKSVYGCCIGMGNAPVMQFGVVKDETVRTEITMDFDSEPDCSNNCLVGGAGFLLAVAGKDKTIHVYKIER